MEDKLFAELLESAHQALEHARGKLELRTTTLPPLLASRAPVKAARGRATLD